MPDPKPDPKPDSKPDFKNKIDSATIISKIEHPATMFNNPHEVVIDPALSKNQKIIALGVLEQDAQQLATAADEGMIGGEPDTLHEVLNAKDSLDLPPTDFAYNVVLKDLRRRLRPGHADHAPDLHAPVLHAPDLHAPDLHAPDLHAPVLHAPVLHADDMHSNLEDAISALERVKPALTPA